MITIITKENEVNELQTNKFDKQDLDNANDLLKKVSQKQIILKEDIDISLNPTLVVIKEKTLQFNKFNISKNYDSKNYQLSYFLDRGEPLKSAFNSFIETIKTIKKLDQELLYMLKSKKNKLRSILQKKIRKKHYCPFCYSHSSVNRIGEEKQVYRCQACGRNFDINVAPSLINLLDYNSEKISFMKTIQRSNSNRFYCSCQKDKKRILLIDFFKISLFGDSFNIFFGLCEGCLKTYILILNKNEVSRNTDKLIKRKSNVENALDSYMNYRARNNLILIGVIKDAI